MKKPTARYCSRRCSSIDPERHERLRLQAQRNGRRTVLPMSRQLTLGLLPPGADPEAQLIGLCEGRDDVPAGLSRLIS